MVEVFSFMAKRSKLGINLNGFTYYEPEAITVDLFKSSSKFESSQNFLELRKPNFINDDPNNSVSSFLQAADWQFFSDSRGVEVDSSGFIVRLLGPSSFTDYGVTGDVPVFSSNGTILSYAPASGPYEKYGVQRASNAFRVMTGYSLINSGATFLPSTVDVTTDPFSVTGISYNDRSVGPSSFVLSFEGAGDISSVTNAFHPYIETTSGIRITLFTGGYMSAISGSKVQFFPPADRSFVFTYVDPISPTGATVGPKNIKVVESQYSGIDTVAYPIHPKLMDRLKNGPNGITPAFDTIRLMNFFDINGTPSGAQFSEDIGNSPNINHQSYGGGHDAHGYNAPWEVACKLFNQSKCNGWVCIPAASSAERDEHISAVALYVRNNLDADRTLYVEYSNETWNSGFSSYNYTIAKGAEMFADSDSNVRRYKYHSYMSNKIARIFKEVFAADPINPGRESKIKGVLGIQSAGESWVSGVSIPYLKSASGGPMYIDVVAGAPYFMGEFISQDLAYSGLMLHTSSPSQIAKVAYDYVVSGVSLKVHPSSPSATVLGTNAIAFSSYFQNTSYASTSRIRGLAQYCQSEGLEYVAYEGGPHMVAYYPETITREYRLYVTNLLLNQANQDPWMGSAVYEYLKDWDLETSGGLFCYFTLHGGWGQYGSWGAMEGFEGDPLDYPKYQALLQFIAETPTGEYDHYFVTLFNSLLQLKN